jgi:hypothetical protein
MCGAFLTDIEYGDDVRVREGGCGSRLLIEQAQADFIGREIGFQQFESDLATEAQVFCEVDLSHAARAEVID